jgi:prevent-host-death family protein
LISGGLGARDAHAPEVAPARRAQFFAPGRFGGSTRRPGGRHSGYNLTSREFNQDTSAKRAARRGPVFITDRGRPAHVLLTIEEYQRLTGGNMSLAEALAQPGDADFEFEPVRIDGIFKPADRG